MKTMSRVFLHLGLIAITLLSGMFAHAWGERGHNMTGYLAALTIEQYETPADKTKIGISFRGRTYQMGHLSNLPDISWKDSRRPDIVKYNNPTHFFDTEIVTGLPTNGYDDAYLNRVRNIEKDYTVLKANFAGKLNPLPGVPPQKKALRVYTDIGTAPWRVQEMYDMMITALRCAKSKESEIQKYKDPRTKPPFRSPFITAEHPTYPYYTCNTTARRDEDIYAAITFAGLMGHFVGDMTQPFHATVDFDGWATGQGGLHAYFETFATHMLDEGVLGELAKLLNTPAKVDKIWQRVKADPSERNFAVQVLLNVVADSLASVQRVRDADRNVALITPSGTYVLGASTSGLQQAKRLPYDNARVLKAFRPIVIDRISTGAVVLSRLWIEAWRAAGEPILADIDLLTIPYALDAPFLWPTYSQDAFN